MTALDRRSVLQGLFVASVAAATVGLAMEPEIAEARRFYRRPRRVARRVYRRTYRRVYRRTRRRFWRCVYVYGNRVCNWRYY
jgi:hypothetical protein